MGGGGGKRCCVQSLHVLGGCLTDTGGDRELGAQGGHLQSQLAAFVCLLKGSQQRCLLSGVSQLSLWCRWEVWYQEQVSDVEGKLFSVG